MMPARHGTSSSYRFHPLLSAYHRYIHCSYQVYKDRGEAKKRDYFVFHRRQSSCSVVLYIYIFIYIISFSPRNQGLSIKTLHDLNSAHKVLWLYSTIRAKISKEFLLVEKRKGKRFLLGLRMKNTKCFESRVRNKESTFLIPVVKNISASSSRRCLGQQRGDDKKCRLMWETIWFSVLLRENIFNYHSSHTCLSFYPFQPILPVLVPDSSDLL